MNIDVLGGSFKPLDFGVEENLRRYGTSAVRDYDLGKVTAPVYVFWARKDNYATPKVLTKTFLYFVRVNN